MSSFVRSAFYLSGVGLISYRYYSFMYDYFLEKIKAAMQRASTPVSIVGGITDANRAEWFPGIPSVEFSSPWTLSHSSASIPPISQKQYGISLQVAKVETSSLTLVLGVSPSKSSKWLPNDVPVQVLYCSADALGRRTLFPCTYVIPVRMHLVDVHCRLRSDRVDPLRLLSLTRGSLWEGSANKRDLPH